MKKILSFLLAFATLLTLASCSSSLSVEETKEETATAAESETEMEEKETGPIVYPEGFSAGFGRRDISPEHPMLIGTNQYADTVADPLYATCVAISDGEDVALIFHMDMKSISVAFFKAVTKQLESKFGIPADHVILNATHSHNAPVSVMGSTTEHILWQKKVFPAITEAAEQALRDLAPAEIYTAKGDTTGFAFVRRYLMADGTYKSVQSANSSTDYLAHETEADAELRTIRFDRGKEKDILMVNWQCHAAHGRTASSHLFSSDFIYELRTGVEKNMDVHFAYYNGASGNLNFTDYLGNQKHANYRAAGTALVDVVADTVKTETRVQGGKIRTASSLLTLQVIQDSAERVAGAKEYEEAPDTEKSSILGKYGFITSYEVSAINRRQSYGESEEVPMFAISCGDLAFATVPFEQFDSDGKAIRDASPYKMTFLCAYSNGHFGYLPSSLAFPHGEYEVYTTAFVEGSSDLVVAESVRLLNEIKE